MSELTLTVIKLGFLAVLWLFVLSVASALRADVFGARVQQPREDRVARRAAAAAVKPVKAPKPVVAGRKGVSRLVVVEGPDRERSVPLDVGPVVIGRGPDCQLALSDEYVSTRHARLVAHDGQWYVEDLGSTNGTAVDGNRVTQPVLVGPKNKVKVGRTVMELRK